MGSGKTTVAGLFAQLGIPVYDADNRAKILMVQDSDLRENIMSLLGPTAYRPDGSLNREAMASIVFKDAELLQNSMHWYIPRWPVILCCGPNNNQPRTAFTKQPC